MTDERPEQQVAAVMAGFIVWLAHQRVPTAQRRRYHREVEEFLRGLAPHTITTARGPSSKPVASGADQPPSGVSRDALAMLDEYLRSQRHLERLA